MLICRADYWPGMTPDQVWKLDADLWPVLALACDQITESRENDRIELERLRASHN